MGRYCDSRAWCDWFMEWCWGNAGWRQNCPLSCNEVERLGDSLDPTQIAETLLAGLIDTEHDCRDWFPPHPPLRRRSHWPHVLLLWLRSVGISSCVGVGFGIEIDARDAGEGRVVYAQWWGGVRSRGCWEGKCSQGCGLGKWEGAVARHRIWSAGGFEVGGRRWRWECVDLGYDRLQIAVLHSADI